MSSRFRAWRVAKAVARASLGEERYLQIRAGMWAVTARLSPPWVRLRRARAEARALRTRYKEYVLQSLERRRNLERELARLKWSSLYRADLDVVAEVIQDGEVPKEWSDSVSVVITNYNYGRYLPDAVQSVLAQTHPHLELVVVDDASTDGSAEVLGRLECAGRVPNIQVRLKHNVGLPTARNIGVKLARSEFVFILDADNTLLPECLASHVEAATLSGADAAYAPIRIVGSTTTGPSLLSDGPFDPARLGRGPYIDAMALFRRSAMLDAGLYDTNVALYGIEDYELWLRFAAQRRKVAFVPRVSSEYKIHDSNMLRVASVDLGGTWAYLRSKYPGIVEVGRSAGA